MSGGAHAGRVDRSLRLQRVIDVLKAADHPLSSEELSIRAYDFGMSKKIMLNVSGALFEVRSKVNRDAGYVVSEARAWKGSRYTWFDGRPRYWLIAAPGWSPSWTITEGGEINHVHGATTAIRTPSEMDDPESVRVCKNPTCGKPLPPDDPLSWCCDEECRRKWRESLFPQQQHDGLQGDFLK